MEQLGKYGFLRRDYLERIDLCLNECDEVVECDLIVVWNIKLQQAERSKKGKIEISVCNFGLKNCNIITVNRIAQGTVESDDTGFWKRFYSGKSEKYEAVLSDVPKQLRTAQRIELDALSTFNACGK